MNLYNLASSLLAVDVYYGNSLVIVSVNIIIILGLFGILNLFKNK